MVILPIDGEQKEDITIAFQISDLESDTPGLFCEYYNNDTQTWQPASISGDTTEITTYANQIIWNSLNDLPEAVGYFEFRITPYDNDPGITDTITIQLDQIGAPMSSFVTQITGEQSGDIQFEYLLSDDEGDTIDIIPEYSIDSGAIWDTATVSGPLTNLDPSKYSGTLTWHSATDLPGIDKATVRFKITPFDGHYGIPAESNNFHLDNNLVPTALITQYPDTGSIEIQIDITLSDDENDTLAISGFFSIDDGKYWTEASLTGKMSDLMVQDYSNSITWSLLQDLGFQRLSNVLFVLIPSDKDSGQADTTGYITILNYPADFTGDLIIDPDDLALFATAWNADPQDILYEIGPATGEVPELIPKPDGVFDFEDLMVFIQMWNWSFAHNGFGGGWFLLSKSASEPGSITLVQRIPDDPWQSDVYVTVDLFVNVNDDLMMVDGVFSFQSHNLELKSISEGGYMGHVFRSAPFFQQVGPDSDAVLFASVGFERTDKPFDETLPVATIRLDSRSTGESNLILDYNLRNLSGEVVESGQLNLTIDNLLPRSFVLHQNYPNPFNPITKIRYEIPKPAHVKLVIYDLLGREVLVLINKTVEPGYYETYWDGKTSQGDNVSSGLYFYTIKAGDFIITKKMILLR